MKAQKQKTEDKKTLAEANILKLNLETISGLEGVKFNYGIAKNIDRLNTSLKIIVRQFDEAKKIVDPVERGLKTKELLELCETEIAEYTPYKIKIQDVPQNIKTQEMKAILFLIEGEPE